MLYIRLVIDLSSKCSNPVQQSRHLKCPLFYSFFFFYYDLISFRCALRLYIVLPEKLCSVVILQILFVFFFIYFNRRIIGPCFLQDAERGMEALKREKEEILAKLSHTERMLAEGKNRVIKLEEDSGKLRRALDLSMTRLNRMSMDSDYLVDRLSCFLLFLNFLLLFICVHLTNNSYLSSYIYT